MQIFSLARDMQQAKDDIKGVKQEVKEVREDIYALRLEMQNMSRAMERLAYEIHRVGEHDASERKMLALQLENEMLKFERRLPHKPPAE